MLRLPFRFHQAWVVTETQAAPVRKSNGGSFFQKQWKKLLAGLFFPVKQQMNSVTGLKGPLVWTTPIFRYKNRTQEDEIHPL